MGNFDANTPPDRAGSFLEEARVKRQLSKSAEPPRGGEAQKALLSEGRRRVPPPSRQGT